MQLSILLPTHRNDLMALSRIAQACSWAGPGIEVIVRDNSGSTEKREQIARFRRDNCTVISAEPCEPMEQFTELMRLAKGEFVFSIADDDLCFDRTIAALPGVIDQFGKDPNVAGITGTYAVETSKGTALAAYNNVDSDDVAARVAGYLSHGGANVLAYSPMRRTMVDRVFGFLRSMPTFLSYHDQIYCLLYLLNGKFVKLPRLVYAYDIGPWEDPVSAQKRDVDFYRSSGLDAAVSKLHWFLCGFEGAVLIRNADLFPAYTPAQRQAMTDQWFSVMFMRFAKSPRFPFDSRFVPQAETLCEKLRASQGRLSFQDMLTDICGLMALSSQDKAQAYFSFWNDVLNRRKPAAAES
ncbi:MAG: hypothetical protein ACK4UO_07160 [Pseudolabrys sp.]